jgi:heme-binding NEAT domain protein
LGNASNQKQEVVFGKSSTNQKTSPTSPQHPSPQKSANNGGTTNPQHGQVYIYIHIYSFLFNEYLRK